MTWQKSSQVICYQVPLLKNHPIFCCRSQAATCGSNASFFWASIHSFEIVELHRVQYGGVLVLWFEKKQLFFFSWRGHIFSLFEMLRCYNNTVSFLQLYLMQRSKKSLASTLILTLGRTKSMTKEVPSLHRICHEIHGFLLTITAFSKSSSSSFSFLCLFGSGIPSLLAVCK